MAGTSKNSITSVIVKRLLGSCNKRKNESMIKFSLFNAWSAMAQGMRNSSEALPNTASIYGA